MSALSEKEQASRDRIIDRIMEKNPGITLEEAERRFSVNAKALFDSVERAKALETISDEDLAELILEKIWSKTGIVSEESDILSEAVFRVKYRREFALKLYAAGRQGLNGPAHVDEICRQSDEALREYDLMLCDPESAAEQT